MPDITPNLPTLTPVVDAAQSSYVSIGSWTVAGIDVGESIPFDITYGGRFRINGGAYVYGPAAVPQTVMLGDTVEVEGLSADNYFEKSSFTITYGDLLLTNAIYTVGKTQALTSDIDELLNDIRVEIPELSDTAIEHYIQRSIIEFCEKSHFWQADQSILVQEGKATYEPTTATTEVLVQIKNIFARNNSSDMVELHYGQGRTEWSFWSDTPSHFTVSPIEDLAGRALSVRLALKPKVYNGTFEFSEVLLNDYFEGLSSGAKAKIYRLPNKPWTDLQLSSFHQETFETEVNKALVRAGRGFARINHRVAHKARAHY